MNAPHLPQTLLHALRAHAEARPDDLAFGWLTDGAVPTETLTYAQLLRRVRLIAAHLRDVVGPGERAVLLYGPGLEFASAFLGCLAAGVIAVPAYPPRNKRHHARLDAIVHDAEPRVVLVGDVGAARVDEWRQALPLPLRRIDTLDLDPGIALPDEAWLPASGDLALLQYTSGSTSTPKGVMVTHGNIVHNSECLRRAFHLGAHSVGVCWLPSFHDMGLIDGVLQPLYTGFPAYLMAPSTFIQRPSTWLEAITRFGGTHCGGPNFAYEACLQGVTDQQKATLDLSRWETAYNGAEPVRHETLDAFAAAFATCGFRPKQFYPCYGLAESTLIVTGSAVHGDPIYFSADADALERHRVQPATVDDPHPRRLVGCGTPVDGMRVEIVDPDSRRVLHGEVGEIWAAGPSIAAGYWKRADATRETFAAHTNDGDGPFMRTGDLGFVHDGELFVTGRIKDLVIIRGRNHYPQDIEVTAGVSHPSLARGQAACFSVDVDGDERLVVVQEVPRTQARAMVAADVLAAMRAAIVDAHEVDPWDLVLVPALSLPKTSSGKLQRSESRRRYLADEFKVVARARASRADVVPATAAPATRTRAGITEWMIAALASTLQVPTTDVQPDRPFAAMGVDSLAATRLAGSLQEWLGLPVSPTLVYDYPTIAALAAHLAGDSSTEAPPSPSVASDEPLAIVGVGCRVPGAHGPAEFWQLLREGREGVRPIPEDRWPAELYHPQQGKPGRHISPRGGFLDAIDTFDAAFFDISPNEADRMDPQQRLLLETTWEAFEHAGIPVASLAGTDTGVFVGISTSDYRALQFGAPEWLDHHAGTGNALSVAANRVSYLFDLHGPSLAVDTACSSSLLAVHLAGDSLRRGECSVAVAGGVNIMATPELTIAFSQARMLSPDGRCKAFDAAADGYVRGEGCGVVVLKRLSDARRDGNRVLAVIRASAVNQDGKTNGLTAPNGLSQQRVLREALRRADVDPATVQYVEAHGTGTPLGDPIELHAIRDVYARGPAHSPLYVGSVKTNIGHLEAAAGVASLIKAALALDARAIPAHLHFTQWNPEVARDGTRLDVPTVTTAWPPVETPRAAVSAFGFGGTNVHVVLEAAPAIPVPSRTDDAGAEPTPVPLLLSAKTPRALTRMVERYRDFLRAHPELRLRDVAFSAAHRDSHVARMGVAAVDGVSAAARLDTWLQRPTTTDAPGRVPPKVAWLFTGQGSQYSGMARVLRDVSPISREVVDRLSARLADRHGLDVRPWLFESSDDGDAALAETRATQPAIYIVQCALVALWRSWGVTPAAVIGHSVGEFAAAAAAGVFTDEEGLDLIAARGRAMQEHGRPGVMVAVSADLESALTLAAGLAVEVAALNAPGQVVLAGDVSAATALMARCSVADVSATRLVTSHAFHTALIDDALDDIDAAARRVAHQAPAIVWVSNLTGDVVSDAPAPDYWRRHARQPVRFEDGVRTLGVLGITVGLEIGPSPILMSLARRTLPGSRTWVASLDRRHGARALADAVVALHTAGVRCDALGLYPSAAHVTTPLYPFEPTRHWFTPPATSGTTKRAVPTASQASLFTVAWEAQPFVVPASGPSHAQVREYVAGQEPMLRQRSRTSHLPDALQALDSVALDWAHAAFAALAEGRRLPGGAQFETDVEGWPARLGIAPRHHRLAVRLLRWLVTHQRIVRGDNGWVVTPAPDPQQARARVVDDYPEIAAEAALLGRCGPQLVEVLSGRVDPLHVLFPGGDFSAAAAIYTDAPAAQLLNGQAAAALACHLSGRDRSDRIRILELGAGTGGLTTYLLPVLDSWGGEYDYVFTDLSPVFLEQARQKFSAYRGVEYRLLDLESLEHEPRGTYDLAVAANAVHAVARLNAVLRGLHGVLRPAGELWLLEGVRPQGWLDLTFGLTEGWWKAADGDGRSNYPLLTVDRWRRLLTDAGFENAVELSASGDVAPYAVIGAARPRHVRPPRATRWVLAGRPGRLREALHAALASEVVIDVTPDHLGEALAAEYINDTTRTHVVMCLDQDRTDERHAASVEAEAVSLSSMFLDALRSAVRHGHTRISIVTRGARPHPSPAPGDPLRVSAASVLWGLGKTTALECPEHWGGLIDLDPAGDPDEDAARLIEALAELSTADQGTEDQQVWRGSVRWVPRLRAISHDGPSAGWPAARGGVLVTGGTGAMGAHAVAGLARAGYRRFCLLSRRGHLADEAAALLNVVRELGATIELVNGDAAVADDVARAVNLLESDGSVLQGIVHAAGIPHAESLAMSTHEDLERVYRAKVQATLVLEAVTRERALDFFVAFSSMVSLWGAKGQAVYAAGNHFLDDWAVVATRRGVPARVINWGPISGGGMVPASELTKLAALGVRAVPLEAVPRVLAQTMATPHAQVAALDMAWDVFRAHLEARGARPFFESLRTSSATPARVAASLHASDDVRELVRREVAAVLGHADPFDIDAERGFFDIGLDSLTIVQLKTRLEQALGVTLPSTLGLEYPSINQLAGYIRSLTTTAASAVVKPAAARVSDEPIAIVGIGCRFPGGASDPAAFWNLLRDRVDAVRPFPTHRWRDVPPFSADPDQPGTIATRMGGFLDHIDRFDNEFFRLSAREAISLDPQHRLLLQVAWEALEDAGAVYPRSAGARVGVFAGVSASDYARRLTTPDAYYATGNALNAAPGRISYLFGFRGPSIAVDTACSSSLVAIRLACQSLRSGECEAALAGGVNLILSMETTQSLSRAKVLSPEGRCRAFDASADGMARAEGCGLVVLKPLSKAREDGDRIYALIRAAGVNQDGASGGFTVPSREAQEDLIRRTLATAGVDPASVDYVEAHGTGTPLGDPIEARALAAVFSEGRPSVRPLRIGSVKTNLGHTESASGVAGVIKTALSLWHEEIPAQLHFVTPSPHIDWAQMPLRVVTERTAWPSPLREGVSAGVTPRRAGVSSFGLSGTNAHLLLEEAPPVTRVHVPHDVLPLVVSAASEAALNARCAALAEWLTNATDEQWVNVAYTLSARRAHLSHRWAIVCGSRREAIPSLQSRTRVASAAPASEEERLVLEYLNGASIDWVAYWRGREGRVISLPAYPFQSRSFWTDTPDVPSATAVASAPSVGIAPTSMSHIDTIRLEVVRIVATLLQEAPASLDLHRPFLEMGADSIILTEAVKAVEQRFGVQVTIRQMFESLTTLEALAQYVAAHAKTTVSPAAAGPAVPPVTAPVSVGALASSDLRELVSLQFQQATLALTQLAQQQLTMLMGGAERPVLAPVQPPVAAAVPSPEAPAGNFWKQETPKRAALTARQQAHLDALITRYTARTRGSKARESQDRPVFADMRTAIGFRLDTKEISYPIIAERSWGARFRDIDGNEYVDMCMGFGVAFFGHQPSMVVDAITEQLREGLQVGPQSRHAADVARLICELTGMERVTFCNSGTEAVMTALRVARAATGRQRIVTFTGSYHGHSDGTLALAGLPGKGEEGVPMAPGVSPAAARDAIVLPYGVDRSLDVIEAQASTLAAVLVEPVQSRRPGLHPAEFLRRVREITTRHGVPLIFDEMITGFRVHPGGCQADFGVRADIATYGKMIGGGLPLGVVAARGSFLDRIDGGAWRYGDDSYPGVERTFYAGTFCKHPLAMAAARAVLLELKRQGGALQAGLNARTHEFVTSINAIFESEQVPLNLVRYGSLMRFNVSGNFSYLYQPLEMDIFCHHLIDRGIYIWEGRTLFLSTAHTDADLDAIRGAIRSAVQEMKAGGFFVDSADVAPPPASSPATTLPLTESQRDLWVMAQLGDDGAAAYIESLSITIDGVVDAAMLKRAAALLAERHEALRVTIAADGQTQRIHPEAVIDCEVAEVLDADGPVAPFVLERAPLWRVRASRAGSSTVLTVSAHHIIADGWSMGVLLSELAALYESLATGRAPALAPAPSLSQFLSTRQSRLAAAPAAAARDYWRRHLSAPLPALDLPLDYVRPVLKTFRATRLVRTLPAEVAQALSAVGTREGCSLFMTVLAGYVSFLHRMSGATDIIVGVPVAGRPAPSDAALVGFCSYMLPVRVTVDPTQTFTQLLASVRDAVLDTFDHQEWPFGRIVDDLTLTPDLSRMPVFSTTFNLDRPLGLASFAGMPARLRAQEIEATAYDVSANVVVDGDHVVVSWDANVDLWRPDTLERWLAHFAQLLDSAGAAPQTPVAELSLIDETTRARMVEEWNATGEALPPYATVHDWLAARLADYGDREAVRCGHDRMSGRQLAARAAVLEQDLRARGIGAGQRVGVSMERSIDLVVALIAIMRTGAAYVPMDPTFPEARLSRMATHGDVSCIVRRKSPGAFEVETRVSATHAEHRPVSSGDAAYVIYTSASTGDPKGVVVSHGAVINLLQTMARRLTLAPADRWLAVTTISFDISVLEIFLPLACGAGLVLATDDEVGDGRRLSALVDEASITFMQATPSGWRLMIESGWSGRSELTMLCGGEALPSSLAAQLLARGRALWNVYGPTETTIWSTATRVTSPDVITIGRPLGNTQLYIADERGHLQPPGVPGELWIGGAGLANGYHGDEAATVSRFVANPWGGPSRRVYRTGDLARWTSEGTVEYLGRLDHQVKVRGFRIELGEVETCVERVPGVAAAVAHVATAPSGESVLAVWYVKQDASVSDVVIRQALESQLPSYMVPSAFIELRELPRTPNGKVDRKALTLPVQPVDEAFQAPATDLEREIAAIWSELLKVPTVGRHDDFLLLGGNSLLAARLVTRLSGVSLRDVLEHRTVAGLAALVASRRRVTRIEIVL